MAQQEQKVATETAIVQPRVITVISTVGQKAKIAYDGNDWEGLKKILERGGTGTDGTKFNSYSLTNMKCVESIKKNTLEHPQAILPDGDFNLFLMPMKSKSGGELTRSEIYTKIKSLFDKDGDKAKDHFNAGKNYTVKSSNDLRDLLESYKPGTKKAMSKDKAAAIADVVDSVKTAKLANNNDEITEQLSGLNSDEKLDLVIKLLLEIKNGGATVVAEYKSNTTTEVKEEAKGPTPEEIEAKRVEDEKKAEVDKKKKDDDEETKRLQDEMNGMMGGFNDVKR